MVSPTRWAWVEQVLEVCDAQGWPACCSPWGRKESDITERLNWTEKNKNVSVGVDVQKSELLHTISVNVIYGTAKIQKKVEKSLKNEKNWKC